MFKFCIMLLFLAVVSASKSYYHPFNFNLGTTWSNCYAYPEFNLTDVTVTPDPVQIGENVTVSCIGKLNTTVTSGSAMLNVSYWLPGVGWVKVPGFPMTWSLCDVTSCPLKPGPYTLSRSVAVPSLAPPGKYSGLVVLTDQNKMNVVCISWQTQLVS